MSTNSDKSLLMLASTSDIFDSMIRLLGDCQRNDFRIESLSVETGEEQISTISIRMAVRAEHDDAFIQSKLARHPSIISMQVSRMAKG